MTHRKLIAPALALLLAASPYAMAQTQPATTPASAAQAAPAKPMAWQHGKHHDGMRGMRDMHRGAARGGVIGDLRQLERLYLVSGRSKEMASVYQHVLSQSQDPRVRDYAYHRLARLQAQPTNVDQAIATLKKGLDENLANEAKMRAAVEQMRANWQSRQGKPATAPSAAK